MSNHLIANPYMENHTYPKDMRSEPQPMLMRVYKVSPSSCAVQFRMQKTYTHCTLDTKKLDELIKALEIMRRELKNSA